MQLIMDPYPIIISIILHCWTTQSLQKLLKKAERIPREHRRTHICWTSMRPKPTGRVTYFLFFILASASRVSSSASRWSLTRFCLRGQGSHVRETVKGNFFVALKVKAEIDSDAGYKFNCCGTAAFMQALECSSV